MENSTTIRIDNNRDKPAQFNPKNANLKISGSKYCSVCGKCSMDYRELIFHEFPKMKLNIKTQDADGTIVIKDRRQVWHDKTLVSTNLKKPIICSSHFRYSDYVASVAQDVTIRCLKRNAVPTLDLPSPGSTLFLHRKRKQTDNRLARMKKHFDVQEGKSATEEEKSSVEVIQLKIVQPVYNPILFAPIFNEFWCNAHKIILPNERWSFCKLEVTECGRELVFSEIMYDGKSKMRSTKKQVVLSCQNGFQFFIHSEKMTSEQISMRINENVSTIESFQSLLSEVDKAEVSNSVMKLSTTTSPHHETFQKVDHIIIDPFAADSNQEQCNKLSLKTKTSPKNININPIADSKQVQCKNPIVSGNKVSLNSKLDKHILSLKSNEIQYSRNDHSRVLPIESVFIKSGDVKRSTTSRPARDASYQKVDQITTDPFADTRNQEQCNKSSLKTKTSPKIINIDSKQVQCKDPIVYGNKVLLKIKNSKIDQLPPNEIQDSSQDYSTIESVFIKEEKIDYQDETINSEQNSTINSEQLMFIKEESCDIHKNDDSVFLSADDNE